MLPELLFVILLLLRYFNFLLKEKNRRIHLDVRSTYFQASKEARKTVQSPHQHCEPFFWHCPRSGGFSEAQIQIHFPPETDFLNRKHLSRIRLMKSMLHSCGNSISNLQQKCIAFGFMRNLGASMLWFIKKHRVQKLDNLSLSVYETQVKKYLFQHSLAWIQLKWYYNKKNRETLKMLSNVIANQNLT